MLHSIKLCADKLNDITATSSDSGAASSSSTPLPSALLVVNPAVTLPTPVAIVNANTNGAASDNNNLNSAIPNTSNIATIVSNSNINNCIVHRQLHQYQGKYLDTISAAKFHPYLRQTSVVATENPTIQPAVAVTNAFAATLFPAFQNSVNSNSTANKIQPTTTIVAAVNATTSPSGLLTLPTKQPTFVSSTNSNVATAFINSNSTYGNGNNYTVLKLKSEIMSEGEEANDSQQSNKEINSIAENLTDSNTNKSLLVHINSNSGSLIVDNELAKDQPDPDNIKMFVGQIPKSWDELQLRKMFEQYGRVHTLNVLRDKVTSMSRGCCFVTYYTRKAALKAQDALHNIKTLEGVSTQVAATEKAANSIYKDGKADYSNKQVGEKIGVSEEWGRLKKRWTNLVEKYKRIKEPPTGTGSEGVDIPTTWPHFERMHIFCSRRHNINPPLLINSEQVLVSQSASQPASQSTSQPISDSEPSAPLARRQKIRMDDDLKASFLKTDKEVRKAAKYLSKFKKNQFNISSSSDSD